jgi:hypothetical protein
MLNMKLILFLMISVLALGCASTQSYRLPASPEQDPVFLALRTEPVAFPRCTPYDDDVRLQQVYRDGFADGWREGVQGRDSCFLPLPTDAGVASDERLMDVWHEGFLVGQLQGGLRRSRYLREHGLSSNSIQRTGANARVAELSRSAQQKTNQ